MPNRLQTLVSVAAAYLAFGSAAPGAAAQHGLQERRGDGNAASTSSACGIEDGVFLHGDRGGREVALTFDACPTSRTPGFSPAIVDLLEREQVPATFFVSGRWAERHPHELARLTAVPLFVVALHGYRHKHLTGASGAAIEAEIADGREALIRLGVQPAPLFRPPFGERPHVLAAAARATGVTPVLWDVVPGDPSRAATPTVIEHEVLRHARGGSIVVMHVNGRAVGTPDALPVIIARLRERGFALVTVSDLLRECGIPVAP